MVWLEYLKTQTRRPAEAGLLGLISDCASPALLPALFSRHRVFEEILVLRCEAFRKLENLKAVAIADGPELDIGGVTVSAANTIARAIAIPVPLAVAVVTLAV